MSLWKVEFISAHNHFTQLFAESSSGTQHPQETSVVFLFLTSVCLSRFNASCLHSKLNTSWLAVLNTQTWDRCETSCLADINQANKCISPNCSASQWQWIYPAGSELSTDGEASHSRNNITFNETTSLTDNLRTLCLSLYVLTGIKSSHGMWIVLSKDYP